MAARSRVKEFTFGRKFVDFICLYDFDPDNFASFIVALPGPVIERVLMVFSRIIDGLAYGYDNGLYSEQDMDVFVSAKRMQDALRHFNF